MYESRRNKQFTLYSTETMQLSIEINSYRKKDSEKSSQKQTTKKRIQFSFPQTQRAHFNISIYTNKMMYKMCFHKKLFIKVNVLGIREKTLTLLNCYQMRELLLFLSDIQN